jgi:hypothetical protein
MLGFQVLEIGHLEFVNAVSFDVFEVVLKIGEVMAEVYGHQFIQFRIGPFEDRLLRKINSMNFKVFDFAIGGVHDGDSGLKNEQIERFLDM